MSAGVASTRRLARRLVAGAGVAVLLLAWFGYQSVTARWTTAELLARQEADAAVENFVTALRRDMAGVQRWVLDTAPIGRRRQAWPHGFNRLVAGAFARYPYPEVFFGWRGSALHPAVVFFTRTDRPPDWLSPPPRHEFFPVTLGTAPTTANTLTARIMDDARRGVEYSIFETTVDATRYQVVARLSYADPFHERLDAVLGFLVNLDWSRRHYFQELAAQVAQVSGNRHDIALTVRDERGAIVARTADAAGGQAAAPRPFPLLFFDARLQPAGLTAETPAAAWTAVATATDATAQRAAATTPWVLGLALLATAVLVVGLGLTTWAIQANLALAETRSDFVSMVTHELKTPIATIQAIGETLASGRLTTPEASREYARLAVHETKRLTRLIDNLLAYARVTDATEAYTIEAVGVEALVQDVLDELTYPLESAQFTLHVDLAHDLPPLAADRTAIALVLHTLLDNAIRYSGVARAITIRAWRDARSIVLQIADKGLGIPADQIALVKRRFVRGRDAPSGGNGLGLAITDRVVADHGGSWTIDSQVGAGTTVTLTLPAAAPEPS